MYKLVCAAALVVALAGAAVAQAPECDSVTAPTLDFAATGVTGDNLVIVFHTPTKYKQLDIDFNSAAIFNSADACSLSTDAAWALATGDTNRWTVSAGSCSVQDATEYRTLTYTFPLATSLSSCEFVNTNDAIFDNTITIRTVEDVTDVFGDSQTRTEQTSVSLQITFPESVDVSATAEVTPSAIAYSAITQQTVDTTTESFEITLLTSVQWPYELAASPAVSDDTSNWAIATDAAPTRNANCGLDNDVACVQTYKFAITKEATPCALDGQYTVDFTIGCAAEFTGSCSPPVPAIQQVVFSLTSANFCPVVAEVATVTADLDLYASTTARDNESPEASDYIFGTDVFARVDFLTEAGVALNAVTLNRLTIQNQCANCASANNGLIEVVINSAYSTTNDADIKTAIAFSPEAEPAIRATTTPNRFDFQYNLNQNAVVFDNAATSGSVIQDITAQFTLEYTAASGQKRIRGLSVPVTAAAAGSGAVGNTARATLGTTRQAGTSSNSQATVLGVSQGTIVAVGVALGAVAVIAVGAAVAIKRRASADAAKSSSRKMQASSSTAALDLASPAAAAATPAVGTGDLRTVQNAYDATQA